MITDDELAALRATSESALPDRCIISRLDWPDAALNASTGLYTPGTPTTVYTGCCRLRPATRARDAVQQGDGQVTVNQYVLTVPHDAGPVAVGDIAEVTRSGDEHVTSRSFRVTARPAGSWQVDQRLTVEEVVDRA